jgi:hypothetical protein
MNYLSWSVCIFFTLYLVLESIHFQHAITCRQKAWVKAAELKTRLLLDKHPESETEIIAKCHIQVSQRQKKITWRKLMNLKSNNFQITLRGKL